MTELQNGRRGQHHSTAEEEAAHVSIGEAAKQEGTDRLKVTRRKHLSGVVE